MADSGEEYLPGQICSVPSSGSGSSTRTCCGVSHLRTTQLSGIELIQNNERDNHLPKHRSKPPMNAIVDQSHKASRATKAFMFRQPHMSTINTRRITHMRPIKRSSLEMRRRTLNHDIRVERGQPLLSITVTRPITSIQRQREIKGS